MDRRSATMARAERIQARLSRALPPDHPVLKAGLSADLACLYEIAGRTIEAIDEIDGDIDVDPVLARARMKQIAEEWLLKATFYIDGMREHLLPVLETVPANETFAVQDEAPSA